MNGVPVTLIDTAGLRDSIDPVESLGIERSRRILDEADVEILLVGDSVAMVVLGHDTTLTVTMDEMLHHTRAVVRGRRRALVVGDMPYMSYHVSAEQAIVNAGRFIQEAGADAVKIEGGERRVPLVEALLDADGAGSVDVHLVDIYVYIYIYRYR